MRTHHLLTYRSTGTRLLWHAAFWTALVAYHTLIFGTYSGNFARELMWEAVALPAKMAATYATLYVLLPRFFMRRRFVRFAAWVTVLVLAAALGQRLIELVAVREFSNPYERADVLLHPVKVLRAVIGIYPVVVLAAFVKLAKAWLQQDLESEALEREKLRAELNYLKTQMQPHFLFNTLNNLYALALRKSERAPDVILKLSDMLSYLLYDGSASTVSLKKEIAAIETYLELEKLRYGERLSATFDVAGDATGCTVPPMLLLPFVENAFKHGISRQPDGGWIRIEIEVGGTDLRLVVRNSIDEEPAAAHGPDAARTDGRSGIGLRNIRRRLDLIYGNRYGFELTRAAGTFTAELTLPLDPSSKTFPS